MIKYKEADLDDEAAAAELSRLDQSVLDLTAERDSLAEEIERIRQEAAEAAAQLAEAKKLNYTLARQINVAKEKEQGEADFIAEVLRRR